MNASVVLLLAAGVTALLLGASLLVRGASRLAAAAGIPPLVIGLTVVAFGTSAPEMAASVAAATRGQGDLALGNVVGSNIFNTLLILGASALVAPLVVQRRLVRLDVPLMILLSFAVVPLGSDGRIGRGEGALLFAILLAYMAWTVRASRREQAGAAPAVPPPAGGRRATWPAGQARPRRDSARARAGREVVRSLGLVLIGLGLLIWGSRWLVDGAVALARALGTSELIIGLTIVAAGTSLPEVATSLLAARKGERDLAVGNVIGSNIFNILAVLGLAALVAPAGVAASAAAMRFDVPVMIAAAVACLPIFFTGWRIDRWEGAVLLGYYVAYVAYLALDASDHDHLPAYSRLMLAFVLPLTALTIGLIAARQLGARRRRPPSRPEVP